MTAALLIDFGSTFTKLRAVNLETAEIIGSGQGPSTVATDVTEGLNAALSDLEGRIGPLPDFKHRLACSSAAGGLSMVTVGLVRELTAEAARQAALGAGARLTGAFAYGLTEGDMAEIEALAPDIILLAGGTDGGDAVVVLGNAAKLAEGPHRCPVVVAGNREAADEAAALLEAAGKPVMVAENVMPEFGRLNVEPTRAAIRKVFMERIVHAKGIDRAAEMFDAGENPGQEANMAKLLGSEAAWEAANVCMDVHGGYGMAREYDVERKFRESRLFMIAPISNNMVLNFLAQNVLGLPRSY